jgi:hypothetical protein
MLGVGVVLGQGLGVRGLGVRRLGLMAKSARTVAPNRIAIVASESPCARRDYHTVGLAYSLVDVLGSR